MKKAIITEKDIIELLNSYDNNNANQVYTSGGLEYSLFEMVSKKFMRTQYTPEWKKAMDEGYVYAHDSAQELFKGINCLSGANNIIVKDSNGNVFPTNLEYFVNELFGTEDFYVPTVNIKTGYTEWKKVLNAFCTGFDDIYRLKFTKGLTIECTSDHKFLRANLKHKPYNCKKDSYRSFDDGLDNENILNLYKIDYKNINDYYQSALFGFFLGDGTLNKQALTFRFAFKKEDKAEYLEFLCDKLNLKFNKTYQKNGYIYYSFPDYKIDKYYSKSELINKYKKNLHMKGLLEGLINSDGSINLDENNVVRCDFTSTNKDIYDLYITACFVNGLKHSYHKNNNGGNRKDFYYTTVAGCKDFLSSINLRNSFSRKICTAIESKKKYNDNNYIKLKDSEYIGYGRVYNLSIEDNHNFMAGIGGFVLVKNCYIVDSRQVIRKGLRTYGDNNIGVASAPPKHFSTALELIEQTMGLAVVYCAGGIAAACLNTFLAPFMVDESDEDIKQALQSLLFQMNQSFKNRGCVAGDTGIWVKLAGIVQLMTFKDISDLLNADYGSTDLTGIDLEILTLTDNSEVKWVKPTLFWRNKPRDLYEVVLPKGRSFKCDKNHGLISANNINVVRNILDIKKGTQLCDPKGINFFTDIEQDTDYWNGVLYGFWLGDGYKNHNGNNTAITVGKKDKIEFLDLLFDKIDVDVNRTVTQKKTDEKHKIPEYVNYYFSYDSLVSEDDNMENKNYLAGLITGMLNSDGSVRIGTLGTLDVSFQNSNEWYVDLLRYALFYFGIRCNKNVKSIKNPKPNWSSIYRLNMEYNKNAEYLYKQLELRPLFKEALQKSRPVKFYGTTNRMLVKSVTPLNEQAETYCFTANGRMIIDSGFILTNNSQSMFSSVNVDLEMPEWLKKETAYGPGGEPCGVYGDYQDEAKRFVHLLTEVSIEGDAEDKPLFMPNLIYNIDGADLNEWLDVFELSAKFSSPYFCHYHKNNVEYQTTLGCLDGNEGIWVKLDGKVEYKTFFELSKLLNADYGLTPVNMDLKVLTIDNNKSVHWRQVKNFIWNKNKELYKVSLSDGKSFVCDDQHELLTVKGINPINIFDCTKGSNILGLNYRRNNINFNIDYMAALYGFYLGDGDKHNNCGCIAVTKDDKKDYLENLLNKLGIDYTYKFKEYSQDERHPNPYMHKFYFPKHIIDNYKPDLTDNNVLAGILSGMLSSDGYVRFNKGGFNVTSLSAEFVSTNFEYVKLFEYCCFNLGLKFRTSLKQGIKDNHSDFKRVYISCNNNTVHVLKQLFLRNKQAKIIESVNIGDYRDMNNYKSIRVKSIEKVGFGDSFCIEVNGRMIFGEDFILSAQCRSALPANWTGDPNIDCMGLGNSVYTTVSLPAIALKTVEEDGNFYDNLKYYMGLVREYNLNRLDWIKKLWYEYHTADFMIQEMPGGRPLYDLDNATIVLGYLGLSEALEILGYGDITEDNTEQARFIMCFMADEIAKWKEEDGLRWGLFQTPAENLAYKNAQKMVRKYGFKRSHAKGTATRPFYTNSNHVPVDSDINLIDRIRIEGNNQPFGPAGNIMNVYLGESYSEASALKSLCEKIRDNTDAYFWAFSSAYSICPECNSKFKGAITKCPFDSAETDVYDRVTGYLTNTKTWNPGKREEFKRRHRY